MTHSLPHTPVPLAAPFVAAMLLLSAASFPAAAEPVGTVVALSGQAERVRGGQPAPLRPGADVEAGDELRTGPDGRLRVRFADSSMAVLGAASRMTVTTPARSLQQAAGGQGASLLLDLGAGILRAVVDSVVPEARFEVGTRTAVASVRGTEWIVEITPQGTGVVTLRGRVAVRNRDPGVTGTVTLAPGQGTDVPEGRPPSPAVRWGDARLQRALSATTAP